MRAVFMLSDSLQAVRAVNRTKGPIVDTPTVRDDSDYDPGQQIRSDGPEARTIAAMLTITPRTEARPKYGARPDFDTD